MTTAEIIQLVLLILNGLIALGGFLGLGIYFAERARYKAGKKNRREQAREDAEENAKNENLRKIIREENKPLQDKIDDIDVKVEDIKEDLKINTEGTVTSLRDRMHAILDESRDRGYATPSTKANWDDLYNTYKKLGGNHFREYVDRWKEALNKLPDEPQARPARTNKKKSSGLPGVNLPPSYTHNVLLPGAKPPSINKKTEDNKQ